MADRFMVTNVSSDAELISACRSGDLTAYGLLYDRHRQAAGRLAQRLVRGAADADDVVAETFARVLGAIKRGSGPSEAFRPYLLTAVRRVATDQYRGRPGETPIEDADLGDLAELGTDPVIASLERTLVARAFLSLPERWIAVLWHTEVERARPAEIALLLGITPNSVAALSYRAREGLRQAYLQMHLPSRTRPECVPVAGKLGAHVRGGLSSRDTHRVECHLAGCDDCRTACAELKAINGELAGLLGPVILGGQAAAYLGHLHQAAATARAAAGGLPAAADGSPRRPLPHRLLHRLLHRPGLPVRAGVALATLLLPVALLVYPHLVGPRQPGSAGAPVLTPSPIAQADATSRSSPAPARSGLTSPAAGSASPSPGRSQAGSPPPTRPGPTPSASPGGTGTLTAKLSVRVGLSGLLNLGVVVVATVTVSDPGTAATVRLDAVLTLPAGIVLLGTAGQSGWACTGTPAGQRNCTHGPVRAGGTAAVAFRLLVVSLAGCGHPVLASVTSGSLSATGSSAQQVQCLL